MPALIVSEGPSAGRRVEVTGETVLGRVDSDFLQHDTEISRSHAVLRSGPQGLEVEDLGSSNGTFVNEERIEGSRPLRNGDVVRLGQTSFQVEVEAASQPTTVRETVAPPLMPPSEPPGPAPVEPPPMEATTGPPPEVSTQPQPPVVPSEGPAYGPPPSGAPAYGAPPAAAYGAPAAPAYGVPGGRPGAVVAGILLIAVGLISVLFSVFDLVALFPDLQLATDLGFGGVFWTLIVADVALILFGLLAVIGGIRVFGLSRVGRLLAIIGASGIIAGWLVYLVTVLGRGLTLNLLAWVALAVSVVGAAVALILLLSASRSFPPR
jgi:hypothetical protein